jgi:hypothetical protein
LENNDKKRLTLKCNGITYSMNTIPGKKSIFLCRCVEDEGLKPVAVFRKEEDAEQFENFIEEMFENLVLYIDADNLEEIKKEITERRNFSEE